MLDQKKIKSDIIQRSFWDRFLDLFGFEDIQESLYLRTAMICVNCECIFKVNGHQCPSCTDTSIVPLSMWLPTMNDKQTQTKKRQTNNNQMKGEIMNLNTIAKNITLKEGGKVNLPVAQVKEVMRLFILELSNYPEREILSMMDKQWDKARKNKGGNNGNT